MPPGRLQFEGLLPEVELLLYDISKGTLLQTEVVSCRRAGDSSQKLVRTS